MSAPQWITDAATELFGEIERITAESQERGQVEQSEFAESDHWITSVAAIIQQHHDKSRRRDLLHQTAHDEGATLEDLFIAWARARRIKAAYHIEEGGVRFTHLNKDGNEVTDFIDRDSLESAVPNAS